MKDVQNNRGFTLIEVVIALSIMAIGILSLYAMQMRAIHGNTTSSTFSTLSTATTEVVERLFATCYTDTLLDAGNHTSTIGRVNVTWNVSPPGNPIPGCKFIAVSSSTVGAGQRRTMQLSFIKSIIQ